MVSRPPRPGSTINTPIYALRDLITQLVTFAPANKRCRANDSTKTASAGTQDRSSCSRAIDAERTERVAVILDIIGFLRVPAGDNFGLAYASEAAGYAL